MNIYDIENLKSRSIEFRLPQKESNWSTNKRGFNVPFQLKRNHDNYVCTWSRTINRRDSDFEVCCKKDFCRFVSGV